MHANAQTASVPIAPSAARVTEASGRQELLAALKRYYSSQQHVRRGVCLLRAGQYDAAEETFARAAQEHPGGESLAALLAACYSGLGLYNKAAVQLEGSVKRDAQDPLARVRYALALWKASEPGEAISTLREGLLEAPECAELHFQLGTMLAAADELDEAELRFTQAISIDKDHADALVSLALCCAVRQQTADARRYLERAQRRRPRDARIGLLLAQAAKSLADQGLPVDLHTEMPADEALADDKAIDQLSRLIEAQPDFIDAFLELPALEAAPGMDRDVYALLAETLNRALDRHPKRAALHCASGRVMALLGRSDEAVAATECAVDLDPRMTRALVQLVDLYQQVDRHADALVRLERALQAGVRYADVYYLLGNLYRRDGKTDRARWAYSQALQINENYTAARSALEALAA